MKSDVSMPGLSSLPYSKDISNREWESRKVYYVNKTLNLLSFQKLWNALAFFFFLVSFIGILFNGKTRHVGLLNIHHQPFMYLKINYKYLHGLHG